MEKKKHNNLRIDGDANDEVADELRPYASPPCYQHEIDPLYQGDAFDAVPVSDTDSNDKPVNINDWQSVKAWRIRQRARLVAHRESQLKIEIDRVGETVIQSLRREFQFANTEVAFYWPLPGEIDLRPLITDLLANNVKAALPVIVEKEQPLEFWEWNPTMELTTTGIWGIPIPPVRKVVVPKILLIPLLGFDEERHRLGHGGGYYDRTLANLTPAPVLIGVGYEFGRLATIYPQVHDVLMDAIVTERGVL